jgi:hypothetical protein
LDNKATSREKALYYFYENDVDYDHIWFIEEDVFIPTIDTINIINNKYDDGDLLCESNIIINEKQNDWPWELIRRQIKLELPYGKSMVCAIRCSKKLVSCIGKYAEKHKNLFMCESLFNTIAIHNELKILDIPELSTIVWKKNWKKQEMNLSNLFHPIKNIEQQHEFRNFIQQK